MQLSGKNILQTCTFIPMKIVFRNYMYLQNNLNLHPINFEVRATQG